MFGALLRKLFKRDSEIFRFIRAVKYCNYRNFLVVNCRNYTQNNFIRNMLRVITTPFCIWRYFFPRIISASKRQGLVFVLMAKNEAPYIEEWIEFHIKQGVSHFIIYDNESTDNFYEVLKPYINSGIVTYKIVKGLFRQVDIYNTAFMNYRDKFRYMAFLDTDEFMFVRKNTYGGGGTIFMNLLTAS